jgi:type I restriction enzyme S subunit
MEQPLHELPEGWRWSDLGDKCALENGDRGKNYPSRAAFIDKGIPVINAGNLTDSGIDQSSLNYISRERFDLLGGGKVKEGDILFCLRGSLGKSAIVQGISEGAIASSLVIVRPDEGLDRDYLQAYFKSHLCESMIEKYDNGAAQPNLSSKSLKKFQLPLPPLNEQQRIVAKLDALFTRIDTAITHLQETLKLSKALFASEANALFEQLAEEFGVVSLASVVKINSGIALPKIFKDWNSSGPIPFYKVAQMNNDARIMKDAEITFDVDVARKNRIKIFPKGSVLIPKRGGAILTDKKRLLVEDASYDSNVMGLKADEKTISDEFLYRFMLSIHLGDYIDTAVIPQINNKHIERMEISPAPLNSQRQIVTHLDALAEHTRTLEAETQERLDQLSTLKSSLLDAAFRGQL